MEKEDALQEKKNVHFCRLIGVLTTVLTTSTHPPAVRSGACRETLSPPLIHTKQGAPSSTLFNCTQIVHHGLLREWNTCNINASSVSSWVVILKQGCQLKYTICQNVKLQWSLWPTLIVIEKNLGNLEMYRSERSTGDFSATLLIIGVFPNRFSFGTVCKLLWNRLWCWSDATKSLNE